MSARAPARQPAPKEATSIARRLLAIGLLTTLMLGTAAVPSAARGHVQFPILSLGSRGADVLALQHLLRHGLSLIHI